MNPYIGGAIITGASSLLGGMMASGMDRKSAREYNRGQMELAKYQNEWNLAQWERENAYNSPTQQMQRFREAGLNPNLIYGQQNLSASSPSAATPNLKPVPRNKGIAKFLENLDVRSLMMDIDLKEAQMNLLKSQSGYYQELQGKTASEKERNTIFNQMVGTDDYLTNLVLQNQYDTNIARYNNLNAMHNYEQDWKTGDFENYSDSRRAFENHIIKVRSDQADLEYDLDSKYGAKKYQAQIYNLIYGTKAQQTAARGSLLSGSAAMKQADLQGDKWNKLQNYIISKYGHDTNTAYWNAVLMFEKADTWYNSVFNADAKRMLDDMKFDNLTDEQFFENGLRLLDILLKNKKK